ncbi:MAG TPA: hypothetical protein VME46_23650 [Acidimicrobiales bacterium]|nr:hypothetical protein [Acidimicrobiales bacterium]
MLGRPPRGGSFTTDNPDDIVAALRGSFKPGTAYVAVTSCDADNAPATCSGPGFPPNYPGVLDMSTGVITPRSPIREGVAGKRHADNLLR